MDDEVYLDDDFEDCLDDYYDLIGYVCMCCGHIQDHSGFGMTCERCCGTLDEYYG